jgi:uncharacterized protein DUF1236
MKVSLTLISATALTLALSLSVAQAEPQPGGPSTANPPAAAGGDHPGAAMDSTGTRPDQPGNTAGNSDQMSPAENKGKSAKGAMPSEGQAGQNGNTAATSDQGKSKGKSAEGAMPEGGSKDAKANAQTEGQGDNATGGKLGSDEDFSGKSKTEGNKPGKSVRLESNDVAKVKTYFSQHRPNAAQRIDRNQVSVSIGIGIPSAIVLYDLPPDVIVVSGACPIKYFVWEDDIVLVDSCTREVVEIISGLA